ncbi:matrixin family metalloprotease [Streptomyces sp. KLOTTS4A1]|uniref:matrixin family metalloprotease n=1 Tax=Streptomyces sp. KLOTTS4A1 TaxID=3390996 RepID=UPI0039F5ED0D
MTDDVPSTSATPRGRASWKKLLRLAWAAVPSLALAFGLVVATGAPASAYSTFNGHRLTYGINYQYYWLDSTAENYHPVAIPAGVKHWNDTTDTKVWYLRTSTKSQSRMDFYRRSTSSGWYCAITAMYIDTRTVDPNASNWWWGKVTIDPLLRNADACGPSSHRDGIIAHEHGHVMGLAHTSSSSTLMYSGISGTAYDKPQKDDRNGINYLY